LTVDGDEEMRLLMVKWGANGSGESAEKTGLLSGTVQTVSFVTGLWKWRQSVKAP
jgi:hypothetical protein